VRAVQDVTRGRPRLRRLEDSSHLKTLVFRSDGAEPVACLARVVGALDSARAERPRRTGAFAGQRSSPPHRRDAWKPSGTPRRPLVQGADRDAFLDRLLADVLVARIAVEFAPAEVLEPGRVDVVGDDLRTLQLPGEPDPGQLELTHQICLDAAARAHADALAVEVRRTAVRGILAHVEALRLRPVRRGHPQPGHSDRR
jgi:hypothetical protein